MGKTDFIISLIKFRMTRSGQRIGLPEQEAALHAEGVISEQGLRGFFGGIKVLGTPDGAIATMVETYVKYLSSNLSTGNDIGTLSDQAIEAIERHRSRSWPGTRDYPRNLFDYVEYRTQLEIRQQFGREPEEMGLDTETVAIMTKAALRFFMNQAGMVLDADVFSNLGRDIAPPTAALTQRNFTPSPAASTPRNVIPFSPTLPDITKSEPTRAFSGGLGRYLALFCKDVRSIAEETGHGGPSLISYPYVFAIIDKNIPGPVHFVTLEKGALLDTVALCEFRADGSHCVLDIQGRKYSDEGQFLAAAHVYGGKALSAAFCELKAA